MNNPLRSKKYFLLIFLILIFCCGCNMYHEGIEGTIKYNEFDNHIVIVGESSKNIEVSIPARIKGKPVTTIGKGAFRFNEYLVSVVLPDSVETIEDYAFNHCHALKSIHIPDSVEHIGKFAFEGCSELRSIKIPKNMTSIDEWTFSGCTSLTSLSIPENIRQIQKFAFSGCKNLVNIQLPKNLELIGENAFCGARNGFTVIPKNVKYIYSEAFEGWNDAPVVEIGVDTSLWDSRVVRNIYKYYDPVSSYVICKLQNGLRVYHYLGTESKVDMPVELLDLPIVEWYSACFEGNDNISSVSLPENLKVIPSSFFENCRNLKHVHIPASVTEIGENAFYHCNKLTDISLPSNIEVIERGAFAYTDCSEIIIPKCAVVGQNVFLGWNDSQIIKIEKGAQIYKWDDWWNRDCNAQVIYDFE